LDVKIILGRARKSKSLSVSDKLLLMRFLACFKAVLYNNGKIIE